MLYLYILWICEAQKENGLWGVASPSYLPWYLTRKVFYLEILNLFEART